jgi:hypothetical protein
MTIVDTYKPNKSYKFVNINKFTSTKITKPINIYLYLQVIHDKKFVCIKYLVLQGQLNYLPTDLIEINNNTSHIINKASIKINHYIILNVFVIDKLFNPNVMKYKFNFTFLNLYDNYVKSFFNINRFTFKNANITRRIQNFNTKKLEDELFCDLFDNIKI